MAVDTRTRCIKCGNFPLPGKACVNCMIERLTPTSAPVLDPIPDYDPFDDGHLGADSVWAVWPGRHPHYA